MAVEKSEESIDCTYNIVQEACNELRCTLVTVSVQIINAVSRAFYSLKGKKLLVWHHDTGQGAQAEDKVLFLIFAFRVTTTLEEAEDGHVKGGEWWGVEMGSDRERRPHQEHQMQQTRLEEMQVKLCRTWEGLFRALNG
eukprot:g31634.t1